MADYTVTYNIKTNTFNTIQQLTELARVAGKMHNAANQINKVTLAIEKLNKACAGSGKGIAIKIDISQAQKQIAALEAQVQKSHEASFVPCRNGHILGQKSGDGNKIHQLCSHPRL